METVSGAIDPTRTPTTMQRKTQIVRYRSKNPILLVEVSADMGRTGFASNSRKERVVGISFLGDNFLGPIPR